MICDRAKYFEIEHFWLLPEFLGQGLGSLNVIISNLAPFPKPFVVLADPNAEAFYARHGFKVIEQGLSSIPGRTLPLMERQIP